MATLLIADRDQTERTGIRWFVQSNRIPFETVVESADVEETITCIENDQPQSILLELEMIPTSRMNEVLLAIRRYVHSVICVTAEATFERAVEAIEFHSLSLIIKPLSQEQLNQGLLRSAKKLESKLQSPDQISEAQGFVSYSSLFMTEPISQNEYSMLIIRPEENDHVPMLYHWLEQYSIPYPVQFFVLRKDVVCVLQVPKYNEETILQQEGQRILQRWSSEYPNRRLNIAIYPASLGATSLNEMYLKTIDLFKLSFFKGMKQLFWANHNVDFCSEDPFLTPDEQRQWITLLEDGNKQGIKNWLYENFTGFQSPYPDPELLRVRFTSILAQLRRFMKTYHLDKSDDVEQYYHSVFQTVLSSHVMFNIIQELVLFIFELIDRALFQRQKASTDVIERGLQYLEANYYQKGLELKDVAEHVGMNPNYYSHLMTERKGQTFRQLLTSIRMDKAIRLLGETTASIQEITDRIGYQDANYFSRVFKKEIGDSPREYRNKEKSKKTNKR